MSLLVTDHERAALADAIHRKVNSSVIAATIPFSAGHAERAAAAVVAERWTPPVTQNDVAVAAQVLRMSMVFGALRVPEGKRESVSEELVRLALRGAGVQVHG